MGRARVACVRAFVILSWIRSSFPRIQDAEGMTFGSFADYLSVEEIDEYLNRFSSNNANISSEPFVYGSSLEGRDLVGICLGVTCPRHGALEDSPSANVPEALFTSLIHAREPMSLMGIVSFINYLASSYRDEDSTVRLLLEKRKLWILPLLNPDGYARNYLTNPSGGGMQRKNCRATCTPRDAWEEFGIDLNRNFPPCFDHDNEGSSTKRCQEDYRGSFALSEPESRALHSWLTRRGNISIALNVHSYGRMLNLPNMCRALGPTRDDELIRHFAKTALENMPSWKYGHPYDDGMLYTVNGALSDYMYAAHSIYAMAPEMGPSDGSTRHAFWPKGRDKIRALAEEARPLFLEALWRAGPIYEVRSVVVRRVESSGDNGGRCVRSSATFQLRNVGFRGPQGRQPIVLYLGSGRSSEDAIESVLIGQSRANASVLEGTCGTLDVAFLEPNCEVANVALWTNVCEGTPSNRRNLATSVVAIAIKDDSTCTVYLVGDRSIPSDVLHYPAEACRGPSDARISSSPTMCAEIPYQSLHTSCATSTSTNAEPSSESSSLEVTHAFVVGLVVVAALAIIIVTRRHEGFRCTRFAVSYRAVRNSDDAELPRGGTSESSTRGMELGNV